ncbi:hypothetical protein GMA19_03362 [Paenibacillus polymyxa E681]|uniref:hypothetical protein n=1 Tax=Paenibacillus polymyxa TaxID=1406 RepID=UPI000303F033|nr:hypothetical protein [Paenibacillus polymyxa]AJW69291.1 hypothetical protein PPE_06120 [Paenibacillus polymyxa E681]QNV58190.1 hypothetical protein GE561_03363 [Paenibacillus polymyxa E681]QNV63026.1 hypothetical protein GMA19_03362 [Paenibacillus polymyxa E681]
MKYLKDCPEPGMGTWYFEIDSDGIAYRQIVIQDNGTYMPLIASTSSIISF